MQDDLRTSHPSLDIEIVGINEADPATGCSGTTYSAANPTVTALGDIPWLQDVDAGGNCASDLWGDSWAVGYRDVIILDGDNEQVGLMNLTGSDLRDAANYSALKAMFVSAASAP